MYRERVLSSGIFALVFLAAPLAWAQPISIGQPLDLRGNDVLSGLTLFTTFDYGSTAYKAKYGSTANSVNNLAQTKDSEKFTLEDQHQFFKFMGPQAGVRWAITEEIQIKAAVGACWMAITPSGTNFQLAPAHGAAKYGEIRTTLGNLTDEWEWKNPGFSATLGGDFVFIAFKHFNAKAGLQVNYLSATGLDGYTLTGSGSDTAAGATTKFSYKETTLHNVAMHLFTIQPHVGLEWRPFQSFLVNSFGVSLAYVLSAGSVTIEDVAYDSVGPTVNVDRTTTQDVGFGVHLNQLLGGYYGWYVGIPHVGNLGAEIQFGSRLVGTFSYQYVF